MPANLAPSNPHSDNEYTFGSEATIPRKRKKKAKPAIDQDKKPPTINPPSDNNALSTNVDNSSLAIPLVVRVAQDSSSPDHVIETTAAADDAQTIVPDASITEPDQTPPDRLPPVSDSSSSLKPPLVQHPSERKSIDPSPDRRHPALQIPIPRPANSQLSPITKMHNLPPPPHLPQPHFSRVPDHRFGLTDALPTFVPAARLDALWSPSVTGLSDTVHNVALLGNEGGLDITRLNRQREIVGRIEGLRGAVLDAKLLPPLSRNDPLRQLRPLVACVIHGPVLPDKTSATDISIDAYQTSVEVYSLQTSSHVQTLFVGPAIKLQHPLTHAHSPPPAPPPAFHVDLEATSRFMTVSLGTSGEVFVYQVCPLSAGSTFHFRCIAKFWTVCKSRPPPQDTGPPVDHVVDNLPDIPLVSLSARWLTIVPPLLSSSQKSAEGFVPLQSDNEQQSTFVSPPPPQVDCEVSAPSEKGLLNRVTKQATQEVVKGAQWVGEQSIGMLKAYWNRSSDPDHAAVMTHTQARTPSSPEHAFPPTHGHVRREPVVKPALISIIDLQNYAAETNNKDTLSPLATFSLPDGCSFVSFDPPGLSLLTSNQLGDSSSVWELSGITTHGAQRLVHRLAHYPRLSHSIVIDVQWTSQGRRVGILTQKGTVHLYEIPPRDMADALRRPSLLAETIPSPGADSIYSPQASQSGWVSNVVSGWQNVQNRLSDPEADGFVDSTRKRLGEAGVMARNVGGRAVRNGYTTALGGAQSLRNAQKNKIRLKASSPVAVRPGCFRWLSGKGEGLMAVIDDETMATYAVKSNFHSQGRKVTVSLDAGRKVGHEQTLTRTMTNMSLPPALLGRLDPRGPFEACAKAGIHGFWNLGTATTPAAPSLTAAMVVPDKETCPQYMPFHRNRQVDLYTFDGDNKAVCTSLGINSGVWAFGQAMPSTSRVNVLHVNTSPDTEPDDADGGVDDLVGRIDGDEFSLKARDMK